MSAFILLTPTLFWLSACLAFFYCANLSGSLISVHPQCITYVGVMQELCITYV